MAELILVVCTAILTLSSVAGVIVSYLTATHRLKALQAKLEAEHELETAAIEREASERHQEALASSLALKSELESAEQRHLEEAARLRAALDVRHAEPKLTAAEQESLKKSAPAGCAHCGGWHPQACPRVKSITFTGDHIDHVEFFPWDKWPHDEVLWAEDVFGPAAPDEEVTDAEYFEASST